MHGGSRRRNIRTLLLYARAVLTEFRWTLSALAAAVLLGGLLYRLTPHAQLGGRSPSLLMSLYSAWMALFAQPVFSPPATWYLYVLCGFYPLLGFGLIGEGVVRIGFLIVSKRHGEKEWMKVKASTMRDHVVLCGLGHLGYRVLKQLLASGTEVVALEKDPDCRFLPQAKATGTPVLLRDMKDDQALMEAGVPHSRSIIIATNDDMANLEVTLDARRMNPKVRVIMRLFDQQIASKIKDAFLIDEAFSSAALAAPMVAAMARDAMVLASFEIEGMLYWTAQLRIEPGSRLDGRSVAEAEADHAARVLARTSVRGTAESPPSSGAVLGAADTLLVHVAAERFDRLAADARGGLASGIS